MRFGKIIAGAAACGLLATPARAALADLTLAPPDLAVGDAELHLNASAAGAVFAADQPGDDASASGVVKLLPRLQRDYDSGMVLALDGTFVLTDSLSRGRYAGPVEKLYGEAHTGLGRVQIGLVDGAGYALRLTGPKTDDQIALEDPQTSFFRDPRSHRAVIDMFALRTAVGASSDYAKFAYVSPELFGAQIALSYTPSEGKQLPFMNAGPNVPGRQTNIFEGALRYTTDLGPVSLGAYAAAAEGHAERKLPGQQYMQQGISDLGLGLRADYPVNDSLLLSLGGSYRTSNAYAFDINRAWQGATTRALHVSAGATYDAWVAALEYGNGVAGAVADPGANGARLALNGMEASLGYNLSPGILVSAGWQHMNYGRGGGAFFDGTSRLSLDAGFLHITLRTTN